MLDPFSRGAMVTLCALCIAGAFVPVRARSSVDPLQAFVTQRVAVNFPELPANVSIARDPFAEPQAAPVPMAVPAQASSERIDVPRVPLGALPSNLSSDVIPAVPGTTTDSAPSGVRITAIVTGAHPYAMLETAGVHEIKGLGDRVRGVPISAIDIDGIRLQNGARLVVSPAANP